MYLPPDNEIVKRCAPGMNLEGESKAEESPKVFWMYGKRPAMIKKSSRLHITSPGIKAALLRSWPGMKQR